MVAQKIGGLKRLGAEPAAAPDQDDPCWQPP